jgi:hypothetical protein
LVVHVVEVRGCRPVNGFGAEFYRGEVREEVRGGPGVVDGPFFDGVGEDEGLVGPV